MQENAQLEDKESQLAANELSSNGTKKGAHETCFWSFWALLDHIDRVSPLQTNQKWYYSLLYKYYTMPSFELKQHNTAQLASE